MNLYIACDHAGYDRKEELISFLNELHSEVIDLGTHSGESVHYPQFASKLALEVQKDKSSKGILICGSGIGVSMVANRYKKVRAARCLTVEDAEMSRLHNNSNVLCLAARMTSFEETKGIISKWLDTSFEGGRHQARLDLFNELGEGN